MSEQLSPGDRAPDFELRDSAGRTVALRDFAGSRVVVYFYPAAMTPGCTTEACDFRDRGPALRTAGVTVLGISRDTPERLAEFAAKEQLPFPLLSDVDRVAHARYGVLGTKIVDGESKERVRRSTFVIGPDGLVERAMYDVTADGHAADVAAELVAS